MEIARKAMPAMAIGESHWPRASRSAQAVTRSRSVRSVNWGGGSEDAHLGFGIGDLGLNAFMCHPMFLHLNCRRETGLRFKVQLQIEKCKMQNAKCEVDYFLGRVISRRSMARCSLAER